ncbi:MAG: hypothetical protein LBQ60_17350 [Bacteroidales bacterium]|jgi:hypothetical protein|nr:hypothetical protein [Bacteroidales bacterium]
MSNRPRLLLTSATSGGFYCRRTIARSVFVSEKFHFPSSKNISCPNRWFGGDSPKSNLLMMQLSMKHDEHEAGRLKKKRGRKPKADKQMHRHMIRLNNKDNERFLSLYHKSGHKSKSRFMVNCILNNPLKIIPIDKPAMDFAILLSQFFAQFRAIKTNYNQVFASLVRHVGEGKARSMLKIIEKPTLDFILLKGQIEDLYTQIRERCSPK